MPEQRLRQQHAHLLAALQLAHLALVQRVLNVEPLQQHRGIALRGVAVFFADHALKLAQAHAVLIGQLGLFVDPVALFERRPERLVAHNDRIDHAVRVKGILVLAQHAELLRAHHIALLRVDLTGQHLHKRRLARAVRPGQAIAPPGT